MVRCVSTRRRTTLPPLYSDAHVVDGHRVAGLRFGAGACDDFLGHQLGRRGARRAASPSVLSRAGRSWESSPWRCRRAGGRRRRAGGGQRFVGLVLFADADRAGSSRPNRSRRSGRAAASVARPAAARGSRIAWEVVEVRSRSRSLAEVAHEGPALGSGADRARRGGSGALNPQSALAGLNSPLEGFPPRSLRRSGRRWFGSRAVSAREPGQVRKEAALSDPRQAQRELPDRSRGRRSASGVRSLDEGCTVHHPD